MKSFQKLYFPNSQHGWSIKHQRVFSLAPVPNYSESMAICKPSKIVNDYLEKVAVKLTPGLPDVGDLPPWDSPQMLVVAQLNDPLHCP